MAEFEDVNLDLGNSNLNTLFGCLKKVKDFDLTNPLKILNI